MMLPESVSQFIALSLKVYAYIFKHFQFLLFFSSNCNLFSSMRGHIQFLVFQKIIYLLILFVTDSLFFGQYAFLLTFFEWSYFALLFLFFQNNRVVTDPNGLPMGPNKLI